MLIFRHQIESFKGENRLKELKTHNIDSAANESSILNKKDLSDLDSISVSSCTLLEGQSNFFKYVSLVFPATRIDQPNPNPN